MDGKMTIKQLADALGVSKTFVRKHMSEEFRCNYTETTANGVITITPEGCKLLSETIGNRKETTENQFAETAANTESLLYGMLQAELDAKNRQIEQLQEELAKERQHSREQADKLALLADQAQQLHAGDIKRLQPTASSEASDEPLEAFQGEEEPMVDARAPESQSGLQEAVKGLSFREKWKLLFRKS